MQIRLVLSWLQSAVLNRIELAVLRASHNVFVVFPLPLQVRSTQMHQQAEFGLAAHWSYKESHRTASSLGWISGEKDADVSVPTTDKVCLHPLKNNE